MLEKGGTARSTGSLTTGAPGGITIDACPPKVSGLPEPVTRAEPLSLSAMCAAPTLRGQGPYSFERTTRTRLPPMLTRATCRTVCPHRFLGTLTGARKSGAHTSCGLAVQVAIQSSPAPAAEPTCSTASNTAHSAMARKCLRFIPLLLLVGVLLFEHPAESRQKGLILHRGEVKPGARANAR